MHRAALSLVGLAALLFLPPTQQAIEQRLQATWLNVAQHRAPLASPITLVAIDEAAIDRLGPWPWPRDTWAQLLERLRQQQQPALIALDVVFPADPAQAEGNRRFAQALAHGPSAIGQLLLPEPGLRGQVQWTALTLDGPTGAPPPTAQQADFAGGLGNAAELTAASRVGHINARIDPDGRMRHLPIVLCLQPALQRCSISLFAAMAEQLTQAGDWVLRRGAWWEAPWTLHPRHLPELGIPLTADLMSVIPWRHPAGLRYVSAADLWEGTVPAGALDHQILLFGGVSLGLGDIATSPLRQTVPGMEVHGQLLRDWLASRLPFEPRGGNVLAGLLGLLVAVTLVRQARRPARLWLIGVAGPTVLLGFGALAWWYQHALWPVGTPAVFTGIATTLLLLRHALQERRDILARVEPYLPAPLRRLLLNHATRIPDETGWGTVMVADILGYTRQSRHLPLTQLATWCDLGIDHIIQHAQAQGAMLDTVAGDGALLLWRQGTDTEQAQAACAAAQAILDNLPALNRRLTELGLPELAIGIGLHAGPYLLGSLGRGQKRYTVVSEAANLAAHIERETRHHPWALLMSKTVAQALPRSRSRQVAELVQDQGRTLALYTLVHVPAYHWPSFAQSPSRNPT